jgi:hypothetical protein
MPHGGSTVPPIKETQSPPLSGERPIYIFHPLQYINKNSLSRFFV